MDTLAKIELRTKFNDNKVIILNDEKDWNKSLFEISEHGQCEIIFISDFPESSLWLEYMNEEGGIRLFPNQSFELVKTNLEDEGYVPGEFILSFSKDLQTQYNGYFTVVPTTFTQNTLDLMRKCIEDKAYGLSRNIYLKKKGRNTTGYSEDDSYILLYLVNNFDYIVQTFRYIERTPIVDLIQVYTKTPISKKTTTKSQRWRLMKGYGEFNKINELFYEPKKFLSEDNKDNQYVKYYLYNLMERVSLLRKNHNSLIIQFNTRYRQLEEDVDKLLTEYSKIKGDFNIKKSNQIISHELKIKQQELNKYKYQIESYENNFKPVNDLYNHLVRLLNETWLKDVKLVSNKTFSKSLLKNKGYLNLYNILNELNKKQDQGNTNFYFPQHQTTKLFEFYCVLLVIDIIQDNGFTWESGWLKDQEFNNKPYMCTLNSGEEMTFIHNLGYRLRISYDKFLNMSFEARKQEMEQLVSVNSYNRRPDIILELFDEKRKFMRAFIIEVKYRRLKYLYNKHNDTDPMRQLAAYRELNYYDPSQNPALIRSAVDSVVVLYPEHDGSKVLQDEDYGFKFIPILPTDFNITDSKFEILIDSINKFLNQFIPTDL